jgi:hypothetical protein
MANHSCPACLKKKVCAVCGTIQLCVFDSHQGKCHMNPHYTYCKIDFCLPCWDQKGEAAITQAG